MNKIQRFQAIQTRDAAFEEHVKNQLATAEIADREGLELTNVGKKIAEVVKKLGIVRKPKPYPVPHGQTQASLMARRGFAVRLNTLIKDHGDVEVSRMTGLSRNDQLKASIPPYSYDWKFAQIERLAAASGETFDQLIQYAFYRPPDASFGKPKP